MSAAPQFVTRRLPEREISRLKRSLLIDDFDDFWDDALVESVLTFNEQSVKSTTYINCEESQVSGFV